LIKGKSFCLARIACELEVAIFVGIKIAVNPEPANF
jgi:hypothetical protein